MVIALAICLLLVNQCIGEIPRACVAPLNNFPFCNTALSVDNRVKNLISLINNDEKPPLLTARMSPKGDIPRIGLPAYDWGANCQHGVQSHCGSNGTRCPTSFPGPNALGATFNMTLIQAIGNVIGVELRALWLQGVGENNRNDLPAIGLDCWSPNININRDPRWGRNQEVPSEDPYLTGRYGSAITMGLQNGSDKRYLQAVVTLKHWAAYSVDNYKGVDRHHYNAIVDEYDLTNTYFAAWKDIVVSSNPKGVMCSYNSLNGIPTCADKFLNQTLRGDFGFDGYITSDSGAVADIYQTHHYVQTAQEAAAAALTGGTDINSGGIYVGYLLSALSSKLVTQEDIDLALYRTLKLRFELGLFDPIENQPYWHVPPTVVSSAENQALNLLATRQSMVLLKNEKMTLPFPKGKKVAVLGPHATSTYSLLGNYLGQICPNNNANCILNPYQAIQSRNSGGSTSVSEGCSITGNSTTGFAAALQDARAADHIVLLLGLDDSVEAEEKDRTTITLPGVQEQFAQQVIALGKPTVVVLINGGQVAIDTLKNTAPAILEAFYPGFWGATAIADVIFGDYNPGGKLPVTIYGANYINQVNFLSMSMTTAPGRSYKYYTGTPLYEFGYGLSYTTFSVVWSNPPASPVFFTHQENPVATYSVEVTNTGDRAGDEVVLAFFHPKNTSQPLIKQLFGFQRVYLVPKQKVTITFTLTMEKLAIGNEKGELVVNPGQYLIEFTNGVSEKVTATALVKGNEKVIEQYQYYKKMHI